MGRIRGEGRPMGSNMMRQLTAGERAKLSRAKVLTTGLVALACSVAPRTVSKWFDSGKLRGYRIPGSQDRRIPREQLIRFMRENRIPLGPLGSPGLVALLAGCPEPWRARFAAALPEPGREARTADDLFHASVLAADLSPAAAVLHCSLGSAACAAAAGVLRARCPDTLLVGVLADDADDPGCYGLALRESDDAAAWLHAGGAA